MIYLLQSLLSDALPIVNILDIFPGYGEPVAYPNYYNNYNIYQPQQFGPVVFPNYR